MRCSDTTLNDADAADADDGDDDGVRDSNIEVEHVNTPITLLNGSTVLKRVLRCASDPNDKLIAPYDSEVYVHYSVCRASNRDTVIDSSRNRNCLYHFTVGGGDAPPMWNEVVLTMHRGEVCELECDAGLAYSVHRRPSGLTTAEKLIIEVELFHWKLETNVTYDGRITKLRLDKGRGHEMPTDGSTITFRYIGRLHDGTVFDERMTSSTIILCVDDIIEGLEEGIKAMREGEHSILRISPDYAFGPEGHSDLHVPSNAQVLYEVYLDAFTKGVLKWERYADSKVKFSAFRRNQGNVLFKAGRIERAYNRYQQALDLIKFERAKHNDDKLTKEMNEIKVACRNNMAFVCMKEQKWSEVTDQCSRVLAIDSFNVKALYRRARSRLQSAQADLALDDIERCLAIQPTNSLFESCRQQCIFELKRAESKQQNRFGGWCRRGQLGEESIHSNMMHTNSVDALLLSKRLQQYAKTNNDDEGGDNDDNNINDDDDEDDDDEDDDDDDDMEGSDQRATAAIAEATGCTSGQLDVDIFNRLNHHLAPDSKSSHSHSSQSATSLTPIPPNSLS